MRKHRLTIFEGPDGAGKTTAAEAYAAQVRRRRGAEVLVVHCGPLLEHDSISLVCHYLDLIKPAFLDKQEIVMDRSWLSEPIYGPIKRDGSRLTKQLVDFLNEVGSMSDGVVVGMNAPILDLITRWRARRDARGEYVDDEADYVAIVDAYHQHLATLVGVSMPFIPCLVHRFPADRDYYGAHLYEGIERERAGGGRC